MSKFESTHTIQYITKNHKKIHIHSKSKKERESKSMDEAKDSSGKIVKISFVIDGSAAKGRPLHVRIFLLYFTLTSLQ